MSKRSKFLVLDCLILLAILFLVWGLPVWRVLGVLSFAAVWNYAGSQEAKE